MAMNNVMLAQLMRDMQDPEMMREAQKMMQDPAFQAYCQKLMANPQFQSAMNHTKEALKDPKKVKEMEDKAKKAIAEGEKTLEQLQKERKDGKIEGPEEGDEKKVAAKSDDSEEVPDVPDLGLN